MFTLSSARSAIGNPAYFARGGADVQEGRVSGVTVREEDGLLRYDGVVRGAEETCQPDFLYDDVFLLDMFKEHLALRTARYYEDRARQHEKLSIHECEERFHLTARETTILGLLMQGLPNDVICSQLTITNNTLKKHILNIYKKLSIRNRTQLFKMVREYAD